MVTPKQNGGCPLDTFFMPQKLDNPPLLYKVI